MAFWSNWFGGAKPPAASPRASFQDAGGGIVITTAQQLARHRGGPDGRALAQQRVEDAQEVQVERGEVHRSITRINRCHTIIRFFTASPMT